jgi:hypothetical protein
MSNAPRPMPNRPRKPLNSGLPQGITNGPNCGAVNGLERVWYEAGELTRPRIQHQVWGRLA